MNIKIPQIAKDYELVKDDSIEELYQFIFEDSKQAEKSNDTVWQFSSTRWMLEISAALHWYAESKRRSNGEK